MSRCNASPPSLLSVLTKVASVQQSSLSDEVVKGRCSFCLDAWSHMAIEVGGYADRRMTEALRDDFEMDATGEHEAGVRVAESVEVQI